MIYQTDTITTRGEKKKRKKERKNTSDLYQACLPSINTNIKLAGFVLSLLKSCVIQHKGKTVQNQMESVSKHKHRGRRGRTLLSPERNFKFTEVTAHSGLQYLPFVFIPKLTSNLQAVASLFIAPTLVFPSDPCACVSPSPAMRGFKPLKHTPPRKSLYFRLLYTEALIKPLLQSPK